MTASLERDRGTWAWSPDAGSDSTFATGASTWPRPRNPGSASVGGGNRGAWVSAAGLGSCLEVVSRGLACLFFGARAIAPKFLYVDYIYQSYF